MTGLRTPRFDPHDLAIPGLPDDLVVVPPPPRAPADPDGPARRAAWLDWAARVAAYRAERWWACDVPVNGVTGLPNETRPGDRAAVEDARAIEVAACRVDPLYLRTVWLSTHETRGGWGRRTGWQPAIPYGFQVRAFRWLDRWRRLAAEADATPTIVWSKPRTVGATGCVCDYDLWGWLFLPTYSVMLLSRKEDLVDSRASGSLFNRILGHFGVRSGKPNHNPLALPRFLWPDGFDPAADKTKLHLPNPENGNEFLGESTTGTAGRSLRATAGRIDEAAFWDELPLALSAMAETVGSLLATSSESDEVSDVFGELVDAARARDDDTLLETDWWEHPHYTPAWEARRRAEAEAANRLDGYLREVWRRRGEGLSDRAYPEFEAIEPGDFPYEPDAPVDGSIDPGRRDRGVLGIFSRGVGSERYRLLDAVGAVNKTPQWFASLAAGYPDPRFDYDLRQEEFLLWVASLPPLRFLYGDPAGAARVTEPGDSWYEKTLAYWADNLEAIRDARGADWEPPGILVNWSNDARRHPGRRESVRQLLIWPGLDVNDTVGGRETHIALKRSRWSGAGPGRRTTEEERMPHDQYSHHRSMVEFFATNALVWDAVPPAAAQPEVRVGWDAEEAAA